MSLSRRQFLMSASALLAPARPALSTDIVKPVVVRYEPNLSQRKIYISFSTNRSHLVLLNSDGIPEMLERYMRLLTRIPSNKDAKEETDLSRRLHSKLWQPVESAVSLGSTIYVDATGFLRRVPFESLAGDDGFVGQRFKLRYLLDSTPKPASTVAPLNVGRGLLFAPAASRTIEVRRLGSAMNEVDRIPELCKGIAWTTRLGPAATTDRYLADTSSDFTILHLATHGLRDPQTNEMCLALRRPPRNGQVPGVDLLSAKEIRRRNLRGRLVVLSACDSALEYGVQRLGGIAGAFLDAGVTEVMASRWRINDMASGEFIKALYENIGQGRDTASALRTARAVMIQSQYLPLRRPYFWAPFVSVTSSVF